MLLSLIYEVPWQDWTFSERIPCNCSHTILNPFYASHSGTFIITSLVIDFRQNSVIYPYWSAAVCLALLKIRNNARFEWKGIRSPAELVCLLYGLCVPEIVGRFPLAGGQTGVGGWRWDSPGTCAQNPRSCSKLWRWTKNSVRGPGIASRLKISVWLLKPTLSWQTEEGSRSVLCPSDGC